jgi:hypothetical protein
LGYVEKLKGGVALWDEIERGLDIDDGVCGG